MSDSGPEPPTPPPYGLPSYGYQQYGQPPQPYQPQYGYQQPPYSYGYQTPYGYGQPGNIRSTTTCIVLFFCTLGLYQYFYNYVVHDEMKRYSGRGIGGGVALLLTFLGQIAMPFVTPAEVGSLYSYRGQQAPVSGWTGLWQLLSLFAGYFGIIVVAVLGSAASAANSDLSTAGVVIVVAGAVLSLALILGGGITWFVKTNSALNNYWASVGVTAY